MPAKGASPPPRPALPHTPRGPLGDTTPRLLSIPETRLSAMQGYAQPTAQNCSGWGADDRTRGPQSCHGASCNTSQRAQPLTRKARVRNKTPTPAIAHCGDTNGPPISPMEAQFSQHPECAATACCTGCSSLAPSPRCSPPLARQFVRIYSRCPSAWSAPSSPCSREMQKKLSTQHCFTQAITCFLSYYSLGLPETLSDDCFIPQTSVQSRE